MFTAGEYALVGNFYAGEPPGRMHSLDDVAKDLGIGQLLVKDETLRQGLNSFKILGVAYAVERLRCDGHLAPGTVLACATDGNHGRAVARTAAHLDLESHIFLPRKASQARIQSIASEGAHVHIVDGNYDEAVRQAEREALAHDWLAISDTSWPGYEQIPRWIMCGYTQMMQEAAEQWSAPPDVVFVQAAVGGLACAAASWFADHYGDRRPYLICCQAAASPCIVEAARASRPVTLTGSLETVMDCLSAGEVSSTAWPVISRYYDAYVTVEDEEAVEAANLLRREGIPSGYSGACGMAALYNAIREKRFGMNSATRVMVIVTEGI